MPVAIGVGQGFLRAGRLGQPGQLDDLFEGGEEGRRVLRGQRMSQV
jgi:hypothetical protein